MQKKEVNRLKKVITIGLIFISIILSGCNSNNLSDSEPSKIFKVKDVSVEKAIAIQVNDKLYIANIE